MADLEIHEAVKTDYPGKEAVLQFLQYGRKGIPPTTRVQSDDWTTELFINPATAKWNRVVPSTEISKILLGFAPRDIRDKWLVYTVGPDTTGVATVHLHSGWTGYKRFEVRMEVEVDEKGGLIEGKDARFTRIWWETDKGRVERITELNAKNMVVEVFWWCMDVQFRKEARCVGRDLDDKKPKKSKKSAGSGWSTLGDFCGIVCCGLNRSS